MSLEKQPVYSRLQEFKVNRKQVFSLLFVTVLLLSSLVVLVKIPTVQATLMLEDGFEGAWNWSNSTNTINFSDVSTLAAYEGTYGFRVEENGTWGGYSLPSQIVTAMTEGYIQEMIRWNTTLTGDNFGMFKFLRTTNGPVGNEVCYKRVNETHYIWSFTNTETGLNNTISEPMEFQSNTWTNLTVHFKVNSTEGIYQLYVDDVLTLDFSGNLSAIPSWTAFYCGLMLTCYPADQVAVDFDNYQLSDAPFEGAEPEPESTSNLAIKGKQFNSSIPNEGFLIEVIAKSNVTLDKFIIGHNATETFTNGTLTDFDEGMYSGIARLAGVNPSNGSDVAWQAWIWDDLGNVATTELQIEHIFSITVSEPSVTNMNAANVACNAVGGGTIDIRDAIGNFSMDLITEGTWVSVRYRGVTITGGVDVIGAGNNQTILYVPTSGWRSGGNTSTYDYALYGDQLFYLDGSNGKSIRISGILFQGSVNFSSTQITYYGSDVNSGDGGALLGILEDGVTDYRIDHCTFLDFTNVAIGVDTRMVSSSGELAGNNGVVDHCIIDNPYKNIYWNETGYYPAWAYGIIVNGAGWINHGWRTLDQLFGEYGAEMMIIEDTSFARCRHAIAASGEGSDAYYVVRRCNFTDNIRNYYCSFIDLHPGARGFEAYDNIFTDVPADYRSIGEENWGEYQNRVTTCDSGSGLFYNNTVNFCSSGLNLRISTQSNETWRTNQWWSWGNTHNEVGTELVIVNGTEEPYTIVLEDEYFLHAPNSSQLGFEYHPLVYPLFEAQTFEEQEVNYVAVADWVSPTNTTYTSSTVGFEVSTVGSNDTGVALQIQLYDEGGAVYPENFTSATGTFTGLTNGTYTAAVYAVGDHGAADYETVVFTVAIPEEPETTPDTTVPTYNSITYSTSLAGNSSTFSGLFNDNVALQSGFISYNFNGMWTNDTSQTFSSTPYSYTKALTLPSANDTTVYWRFYVVDTSGNWLVTPIFSFTTTVNLEEESPLPTPTVTPTSPPTATPTTTPEPTPTPIVIFDTTTFYFRSDNYQYNTSLMGYGLDLTNTNLQLTISDSATSSISYGFRVWLLRSSGRIVELTSGAPVAIVSRTSEGSGYQSATWTVPSTLTVLGMDRLLITIYAEVDDSGSWITRATYLSNKLMTKQILSATWNFTLYTSLADSTGSFRFGSGTYESKIEGVGFKVPAEQEIALFYAGQGDFVGAVLHPFIFWIGNLFYGLALLFAAGTVYLRYKKFEPVLILVILFGGGGSLGFLIPDVAYRLYYFLLLFVIAVVFWRVFK